MSEVTRILNRIDAGDPAAAEKLLPLVYDELRTMAALRLLNENPGQTLQATALVHEAWLKLENSTPGQWRDRKQFFAYVSEVMRRILVDAARRRVAAKRGGGDANVPAEDFDLAAAIPDERLLDVHEVIDQLEEENELNARIVKLRFFGGMKNDEIAALLEVNEKTVRRHWEVAKVWLYRALKEKT